METYIKPVFEQFDIENSSTSVGIPPTPKLKRTTVYALITCCFITGLVVPHLTIVPYFTVQHKQYEERLTKYESAQERLGQELHQAISELGVLLNASHKQNSLSAQDLEVAIELNKDNILQLDKTLKQRFVDMNATVQENVRSITLNGNTLKQEITQQVNISLQVVTATQVDLEEKLQSKQEHFNNIAEHLRLQNDTMYEKLMETNERLDFVETNITETVFYIEAAINKTLVKVEILNDSTSAQLNISHQHREHLEENLNKVLEMVYDVINETDIKFSDTKNMTLHLERVTNLTRQLSENRHAELTAQLNTTELEFKDMDNRLLAEINMTHQMQEMLHGIIDVESRRAQQQAAKENRSVEVQLNAIRLWSENQWNVTNLRIRDEDGNILTQLNTTYEHQKAINQRLDQQLNETQRTTVEANKTLGDRLTAIFNFSRTNKEFVERRRSWTRDMLQTVNMSLLSKTNESQQHLNNISNSLSVQMNSNHQMLEQAIRNVESISNVTRQLSRNSYEQLEQQLNTTDQRQMKVSLNISRTLNAMQENQDTVNYQIETEMNSHYEKLGDFNNSMNDQRRNLQNLSNLLNMTVQSQLEVKLNISRRLNAMQGREGRTQ